MATARPGACMGYSARVHSASMSSCRPGVILTVTLSSCRARAAGVVRFLVVEAGRNHRPLVDPAEAVNGQQSPPLQVLEAGDGGGHGVGVLGVPGGPSQTRRGAARIRTGGLKDAEAQPLRPLGRKQASRIRRILSDQVPLSNGHGRWQVISVWQSAAEVEVDPPRGTMTRQSDPSGVRWSLRLPSVRQCAVHTTGRGPCRPLLGRPAERVLHHALRRWAFVVPGPEEQELPVEDRLVVQWVAKAIPALIDLHDRPWRAECWRRCAAGGTGARRRWRRATQA